jgi:tetratricopeptide (TPR) repeat protein
MTAAVKLLGRASALLPPGGEERLELAAVLADALFETGQLTEGLQVLTDAEDEAGRLGLGRLRTFLHLRRLGSEFALNPQIDVERILAEARAAVREFPDDEAILATAWERIQDVEWFRGRLTLARAAAERAFEYTGRIGDVRRQAEAQSIIAASAYYGGAPIAACIEQVEESREWAREHGALAHEAMAIFALGTLMIEQGHTDEGHKTKDRASAILDELGMAVTKARLIGSSGAHIGLRHLESSEQLERLRASFDLLARAGETGALSTVAGNLALALYAAGDYDEADRAAKASEETGSPEDVVTQVVWRAARAMLLARGEQFEEAERLARESVALATAAEYFEAAAEAYLGLGEVLRLAERPEEARDALDQALAGIEGKGWDLSASFVRARIAELQSGVGSPSETTRAFGAPLAKEASPGGDGQCK